MSLLYYYASVNDHALHIWAAANKVLEYYSSSKLLE